jgi:hypothetical protein
MSTLAVNTITNAAGGNTAQINGMTPTADSLQGFRNRLINSDMRIDQRNAGASVATSSGSNVYTLDRWQAAWTATSKFTIQRSTVAPAGFTNSLLVTSSAATAVASTDYYIVSQNIEGFNLSDLGFGTASAQSVTLSFWVRSSLTGTFGGALNNGSFNRGYPFTFTISAANIWEYKTVTVAGDTTGTWATDSSGGMYVMFGLGAGASVSGTAGAWAASGFRSATGAVSVVGTSGATFYITGVQLEAGSVATPFERRPYGTELSLCQRYYEVLYADSSGSQVVATQRGASSFWSTWSFCVEKRAAPTFSLTAAGSWAEGTPTVYTSVDHTAFSRTGTFFAAGSTGAAVFQATAEL